MFGLEPLSLLVLGFAVVQAFVMVSLCVSMYRKASPNQAMIISGFYAGTTQSSYKIVVGGGAVVLPVLQQVQYLSLEVHTIRLKTAAPLITSDGIPLSMELSAQVKVKNDYQSIATAAERMLGKSKEEMEAVVAGYLLASLRSVVSSSSAEQVKRGFESYLPIIADELNSKLGITCTSLALEKLDDPQQISATASTDASGNAAIRNESALQQSISTQLSFEQSYRFRLISEYDRAMPILEHSLGEQNIVFKDFLLRFATIAAGADDYASREKAEQLMHRACSIQPAGIPNSL
jgi:flotillin